MYETRVLGTQGPLHSARESHPRESFSHRWVCTHRARTIRPDHTPLAPLPSGTLVGPGVGDSSLSPVLQHPIRSSETGGGPFKDTELFVPKRVTSTKIIREQFS